MTKHLLLSALTVLLLQSCSDDPAYKSIPDDDSNGTVLNLPDTPYNYSNIELPSYFFTNDGGAITSSVDGLDNMPDDNVITDNGATLGRVLFYDANLSLNRTTACGTCHRAEKSYADSSPLSHGLAGDATKRNSISLVNARFYKRGHFFYDERAATLEDQVLMPMLDHGEMRMTEDLVLQRVAEQSYYNDLFVAAFGTGEVSTAKIRSALAQFIRSIVSFNSKYDAGRAQVSNIADPFPNFTNEENRGKELFVKPFSEGGVNCFACHTTEAFVSPNVGPINNGLDAFSVADLGAYDYYTNSINLTGAFKIPTLRNIAFTGPYMHDGRFTSLIEVVEFYNSGIQGHAQLSPLLKDAAGQPRRLNLTDADKAALVKFLNTLTDTSVMADPRWIDPFINQHL